MVTSVRYILMVLSPLVTLVEAPIPILSVVAMRTPNDLLRLISEWYPKSQNKLFLISTNSVYMKYDVDSNSMGGVISSLYNWNFTPEDEEMARIRLCGHQIKRISDRVTCFGVVSTLDLRNNKIECVDLRRSKIDVLLLSSNSINSESFSLNQMLFPHGLFILHLSNNPVHHLSNYVFPKTRRIKLNNCGLVLLQNVVFEAERVHLDYNPGLILQNVTFIGTKYLSFVGCNISRTRFLNFEFE